VKVYALDASGQRRGAVAVEAEGGKTLLSIDGRYRTVWYEVEVR
jgi:hypothetical protein